MRRMVQKAGLAFLLMIFVLIPLNAHSGWLDPAWNDRSTITIANPGGTILNDFQVRVALGSSFDFSKAKSDGSDMRFTSDDGVTQIPFWIESWNPTDKIGSIWVKVPMIQLADTTLYLYYGNAAANSDSNGAATFEFFDDFDSTGTPSSGYFNLGAPQTILVRDQSWESSAPHTLSVVEANSGGYKYWGYYGLAYGCGGVGLAYSNDLVNWAKHSGNPLFLNGRWPSVLKVGSTFYMLYTKDFCATSYIVLAVSSDGIYFSDVKTIVQPQAGIRNQNPNLFYNPNDEKYYIYWYNGNDSSYWQIRVRSAFTIDGLDNSSSETIVLQSNRVLAAPDMLFYGGTYFLSTESLDLSGNWQTQVYSSTSPTSGFTLLPGNPVLSGGSACNFQHIFGNNLHDYYCKQTNGNWTIEHRVADLSAGRLQFFALDTSKWTATGGTWWVTTDTGQNGTVGGVVQGDIGSDNRGVLLSNYQGSDYILEAYGRLLGGRLWGLGVRATDHNNLYSSNLYEDLDSTYNLYEYNWVSGSASTLGRVPLGTIDANMWYKLSVKVHGNAIDVYKDDVLVLQSSSSRYNSGAVALYGERNTVAQFNNVLVRKYAATEPSVILNPGSTPIVTSVALNPTSVVGGNTSQGTVSLSWPAPSGGVVVSLSSSNTSIASVPSGVTVPAGATSANFTVNTSVVAATYYVTISASYGGPTQTTVLTVTPPLPEASSLTLNPASLVGGSASQGTVVLNGPAPGGGAVVSLSSNNTAVASVPANVMVPGGSTSTNFTVTTSAVGSTTYVTISASSGGATQTAGLTVTPPGVSSLTLNPTSVVGGNASQGTVVLSGPAPSGGVLVSLSSSNTSVASVQANVTVPAGSTNANFTVSTSAVPSSTPVTITASYGGGTQTAGLTVTSPGVSSLALNPTSVVGGNTSQGTVVLSGPAPSGGAEVLLTSSDVAVASVPASVTVPGGSASANFMVSTSVVPSLTSVTISASYGGSTQTVILTVRTQAGGGWLDPAWANRSVVAIANSGGTLLTDFQVHVALDSTFNFAGAKSDGSDVRFTSDDGVTQIPFWVESWNSVSKTASLWMKVPTIASGGGTLYMYYGNPNASSASSGAATFEFFDDFNSPTLDTSKWRATGGSWGIVMDTQPDGSVGGVVQGAVGSDVRDVLLSSYQGSDYVLEAYGRLLGGRVWGLGVRATDQNNLYSSNLYADLDSTYNLYEYNWVYGETATLNRVMVGTIDVNAWYKLSVKVHGYSIEVYKDNVLMLQTSSSQHGFGGVALYGERNTIAEFNNVLVRKYTIIEPTAIVE